MEMHILQSLFKTREAYQHKIRWYKVLVMHFALIKGAIFMQSSEQGPGVQASSIGMHYCCPLSIPAYGLAPSTICESQYTIRKRETLITGVWTVIIWTVITRTVQIYHVKKRKSKRLRLGVTRSNRPQPDLVGRRPAAPV